MSLATVAASIGGSPATFPSTRNIATPFGRGFATVLWLRFDTAGTTDAIAIDSSSVRFEAAFQALDYDALHASPAPALRLSKDGQAVIIQLDGPRQVLGVTLAAPGRSVELHRADGPVQADKAADPADFTDVNFAAQFAAPVAVNQVAGIQVRGKPSNPRLGIAAPDLSAPTIFWPPPEAAGQLTVSAGAALAGALQDFVAAAWKKALQSGSPPSHLDAALVIQSDAPCRIVISQLQVGYGRLLTAFSTSAGPKEVLRYSGRRVERQSLFVKLPAAAAVTAASVEFDESFRAKMAGADAAEITGGGPLVPQQGVRLRPDGVAYAAPRRGASAVTVQGVALGAMALNPGATLSVELQTDSRGTPSGKVVARASAALPRAGAADWAIATFDTPVALAGEPSWILAQSAKGEAVWLAGAGGQDRLLRRESGVWGDAAELTGARLEWRLLPVPAIGTEGADPLATPQVSVTVGSTEAPLKPAAGGRWVAEFTAALNKSLTAARASAGHGDVLTLPIVFSAASPGLITVYPPLIVYNLTA